MRPRADFARYYSRRTVYLKGNVFVRMGKDDIHSDEAELICTPKPAGDEWPAMEGPHIISAARGSSSIGGSLYLQQGKVTTCDGTSPAWSMNAEQAVVEIDGMPWLPLDL